MIEISFDCNTFAVAIGLILVLISAFFVILRKTLKFIVVLRILLFGFLFLFLLKPAVNIVKKENIPAKVFYIIDSSIYMRSEFSDNLSTSKIDYVIKYLRENKVPAESIYFAADKIYKYEDFNEIPLDSFYTDFENSVKNCQAYSCDYDRLVYFTDGYSDFEFLKNMDIVFVGDKTGSIDKFIGNLKHPEISFLHIPFNIYFSLSFQKEGLIELMEDGKRIYTKKYSAGTLSDFITLKPDKIGKRDYRICAVQGKEKQCIDFSVNVLREKLRILYLCGIPNHHYYFLREYLKSNPNIELVSFVILREPFDSLNVQEQDLSLIPFPRDEIFLKDIFHFDILILEEFNFQEMGIGDLHLDNVVKFVEKGGSLLIIGSDIMTASISKLGSGSLRKILPSYPFSWFKGEINNFYFLSHPLNASINYYLPEICGNFSLAELANDAKGVISFEYDGKKYPLISEKEYGKGRILMINSSGLWQWKLKGFKLKDNYYFNNFYRSIFSWLDYTLGMKRVSYSIVKGDKFYVNAYALDENYRQALKDEVKISGYIFKGKFNFPLTFRYINSGIYRAYFPPLNNGKYNFKAISYFQNGKKEEYADSFFIETENTSNRGYSEEKFKEALKFSNAYLFKNFDLKKYFLLKREMKTVVKKIYPTDNVYFFLFLILIFSVELVYRRLKGEI